MIQRFIYIGCGPKRREQTPPAFQSDDWQEVRFDIDDSVNPDIIGTMTDMSEVEICLIGALYTREPNFLYINSRKVNRKSGVYVSPSI